MNRKFLVCRVLIAVAAISMCTSPAAAQQQPRRRSAAWRADLISVLIEKEMLDSAEAICARHFGQTDAASEDAARWAIRWSSVRAARVATAASWQPELASAARQPIEKLLQAYPDHSRALWLQTQLAFVDMATVRFTALQLAITPEQQDLQSRGLKFVTAALRHWESVSEQVQAASNGNDENLRTLQQTIRQQRVEALLWRSRLFVPGSDDAIASATEAEREAREALARLSPGSRAHQALMLLRVEALTAVGNVTQAMQVLEDIQRAANGYLSAEGLALQIRALLAKQDWTVAGKQLQAYFGAIPEQAPESAEMDLARLAYLLMTVDQADDTAEARQQRLSEIADWLDAIERRNGMYVRRRGEAETLRVVRVQPSGGDTRLLAAEAARQLRAGKARQAGELLTRAAAAAADSDQALRYAAQSAAILKSVDRLAQAAEVLSRSALQHPQNAAAPALHLQAAWLTAEAMKRDGDTEISVLRSVLEVTANRWPGTPECKTAIDWLIRLLKVQGEYAEAAEWALSKLQPPSVESIRQGGQLWQMALRHPGGQDELDRAFASLQPVSADEPADCVAELTAQRLRLAALFADPDMLRQRFAGPAASENDAFIASLLVFRRDRTAPDTLSVYHRRTLLPASDNGTAADTEDGGVEDQHATVRDAVNRLLLDGQIDAADRLCLGTAILRLLDSLGEQGRADLIRARALSWSENWQDADQLFKELLAQTPGKLEVVRAAAESLGESAATEAKRRAIEYWTKISAGVPQGSEAWHQAKIETIRLHLAVQDQAAAAQLCKFILLTRPPADEPLRMQYERLLKQAGG